MTTSGKTTLVTRNEIQTETGNSCMLELPGLLHGHQKLKDQSVNELA